MRLKRKLVTLLLLIILIVVSIFFFPGNYMLVSVYDKYVFFPFQSLRTIVLSYLPFSFGDIMYIILGIALLTTVIRWVYFITRFGRYKNELVSSILNTVNSILFIYLFFFFGWGANYYKMPLAKSWKLYPTNNDAPTDRRKNDSVALVTFNKYLLDKLNSYAPGYHYLPFAAINDRSKAYYRMYTDSKVKMHGLEIKPSVFGYFIERTGVDGYYNPFTGEGQVNTDLPSFVMPFIISHEMAHQCGIAAEGDANLMAYALGTAASDSMFNYSAYLDIWLYANNRLYHHDSALAKHIESQLNKLTLAHLDTLEQLSRLYHNQVTVYSAELYDNYLKMQDQKDGIRSYGNVVSSAWKLELERTGGIRKTINIPY